MSSENVSTHPRELAPETLDPRQVETFLSEHPAFFKHRPELLTALELPHGGAGAVSLVERQVNLLRERNIDMRARLANMTENARQNDALFEHTRATVLALLEVRSIDALESAVMRCFKEQFGVEMASLIWLPEATSLGGESRARNAEQLATIEGLMRRQQAFTGVFRADEMAALFAKARSEGSAAMAPIIVEGKLAGVLAVGSEDVHRYDTNVGTVFLEYVADVVARLPLIRGH